MKCAFRACHTTVGVTLNEKSNPFFSPSLTCVVLNQVETNRSCPRQPVGQYWFVHAAECDVPNEY